MAEKKTLKGKQGAAPPPFLTADDLPDNGKPVEFTIGKSIGLYQRDDGTTSLFIAVVKSGDVYTLSVRCKGPDRINLQNACGRNLIEWPGKRIKLIAVEGSQGGRFVNVYNPNR